MLRIVLPVAVSRSNVLPVVYAVGVVDEIVVVVDGNVVISSPPCIPTATSAPRRSHCDTDAEGDCHAGSVIARRGIRDGWVRIDRRTVYDGWVVAGDVDDLGTRGFNYDDSFTFDNLSLNLLLVRRL